MSIELIQLVDNTMGNNVYLINDRSVKMGRSVHGRFRRFGWQGVENWR